MRRIWQAFFNSLNGLLLASRGEQAFRQDVLLFITGSAVAVWLAPDRISLILLITSLLLVLIVELLNTGIEAAIDRIGPEIHPEAKKAKDCASAAVFVSLLLAGLVWVLILF